MRNTQFKDLKVIEKIIKSVNVCHVAFVDDDKPYVLPFNFGYSNSKIYIHSALTGRKIDIIRKNNNVCVSFEADSKLYVRNEEVACSYSMTFKSVVASGTIHFIENAEEKKEALNLIMEQYTGKKDFSYNLPAVNGVLVMRIDTTEITARIRE